MKKAIAIILSVVFVFIAISCNDSTPTPSVEYKGTFYAWDSKDPGLWVKTDTRAAEGKYDLELSFNKGKISLSVDGKEIHSYELKDDAGTVVDSSKVKSIILQSLNNGKEYTVEWTLPVVNGNAVKDSGWVVDRTAPKDFSIADGKVSITTTNANLTDFYRYQGKKIESVMADASETWSIKTSLSFDKALLDDVKFAPSIWLQVADSAETEIDWAIIELKSDAE